MKPLCSRTAEKQVGMEVLEKAIYKVHPKEVEARFIYVSATLIACEKDSLYFVLVDKVDFNPISL